MALPFKPAFPWLLYAYPWMPYPRRTIIYMREKGIPPSMVQVVQVSDPQDGNEVVDKSYPPRPKGSLPILAIPSEDKNDKKEQGDWTYIRQSMAQITLLEELCNKQQYGFSAPHGSLCGNDLLSRVRIQEVTSIAEQMTSDWNPVRMFGTKAGTMSYPAGSREMLRWVHRSLMTIETWWQEEDRDMALLRDGSYGTVTIADVVLYQFLEFAKELYGVDMTIGSGETVTDVYGRNVKQAYPKLMAFYENFSTRKSVERSAALGEFPGEQAASNMQTWADGILS